MYWKCIIYRFHDGKFLISFSYTEREKNYSFKKYELLNECQNESTGNESFPRLSGKVAAKPSEGASVSRYVKEVLTERY